jgi:hypothetical protein
MPNEFKIKNGLVVDQGGAQITGSLTVTQGITGSLFGTASWAESVFNQDRDMSTVKIGNRCPDNAFKNAHGNLVIGSQQYYGTRVGGVNSELIRFPNPDDLSVFQKITMATSSLGSLEYLCYNATLGKIYGCLNPNKLLVVNDINDITDYNIIDITISQGIVNNGSVIMTDDDYIYIGTNQSPNAYFIKLDATDYSEVENVEWTGYSTVHSAAWNYDKSELYFAQNGAICYVAIINPTNLSFTTHFAGTSITDDIAYIEYANSDINSDAWLFLPGENRVVGSTTSYLFNVYTQESFPLVSLPSTGCYWDSTNFILYSSCTNGFIETWTGDDLIRSVFNLKDPRLCTTTYVNKEGLWLNEIQNVNGRFFCTAWNNEVENGGDGKGSLMEVELIKINNTAISRTEQVLKSQLYFKKEVTETLTAATFLDVYFANGDWDQLNGLKYGVSFTPNDSLTAVSLDKHYIGIKSTNYFRINFNASVTGTLSFTVIINP